MNLTTSLISSGAAWPSFSRWERAQNTGHPKTPESRKPDTHLPLPIISESKSPFTKKEFLPVHLKTWGDRKGLRYWRSPALAV